MLIETQASYPDFISDESRPVYKRLYFGLRDEEDPVTWRTTIVDLRRLLGLEQPDWEALKEEEFGKAVQLAGRLIKGTWMEALMPEVLTTLGFGTLIERTVGRLDSLFLNGRHLPEPLLYRLADEWRKEGEVAVVNPVGHYQDGETRIVGLHLVREIERLVIMASTQTRYGGSYEVLARVMGLLRNREFSSKVGELDIVIPMFGGSRGHRLGQDTKLGYEVLEAKVNARFLALVLNDIYRRLRDSGAQDLPRARFISVDIHNLDYPPSVFEKYGFEFVNANPAPELAGAVCCEVKNGGLGALPMKVLSLDKGAIPRTEKIVEALLLDPQNGTSYIDMVYIENIRLVAGRVKEARVVKVEMWFCAENGEIKIKNLEMLGQDGAFNEECVVVFSDDMLDTGGTARENEEIAERLYPGARLKIFTATHAVLSKGKRALDRVGADVYIFGNTLKVQLEDPRVKIVDVAPAIKRAILTDA